MDGFKKIVKMKTGGLVKSQESGKKADAPAAVTKRPTFKGSDVAKEKSKPAGHKDPYIKSKESGKTADFPSAAVKGRNKKSSGTVSKFKCGGGVKKMADGGILDTLKNNIMGTPAQNAVARQNEAKYLRAKQLQRAAGSPMGPAEQMATGLAGAGQQLQPAPAPMPAPQGAPMPAQKKGGKVKGKC